MCVRMSLTSGIPGAEPPVWLYKGFGSDFLGGPLKASRVTEPARCEVCHHF
jgi:hypothetical protein